VFDVGTYILQLLHAVSDKSDVSKY